MAKTTFQGPVKSINGFQGVGTGKPLMEFYWSLKCSFAIIISSSFQT